MSDEPPAPLFNNNDIPSKVTQILEESLINTPKSDQTEDQQQRDLAQQTTTVGNGPSDPLRVVIDEAVDKSNGGGSSQEEDKEPEEEDDEDDEDDDENTVVRSEHHSAGSSSNNANTQFPPTAMPPYVHHPLMPYDPYYYYYRYPPPPPPPHHFMPGTFPRQPLYAPHSGTQFPQNVSSSSSNRTSSPLHQTSAANSSSSSGALPSTSTAVQNFAAPPISQEASSFYANMYPHHHSDFNSQYAHLCSGRPHQRPYPGVPPFPPMPMSYFPPYPSAYGYSYPYPPPPIHPVQPSPASEISHKPSAAKLSREPPISSKVNSSAETNGISPTDQEQASHRPIHISSEPLNQQFAPMESGDGSGQGGVGAVCPLCYN
eukprot:TRINITY_DN54925_c0_g1_i1.p1 TRINITY_DN54925_c0_g1~~TRINITY_DN54925_c0_g1_i1.p1  ORF type:complete len:373 (-),score=75.80 TRINITY_DN54925_c0_g1_i1:385-1503(-)